ncbi:MAG: DUF924 family protein [Maricaulis sp.]|jgi:uncharacterized protein (DUF924 family)|uniref:DUF924 family protein n=1 Tax=Maricaulis sp. TaxID=1486257 RepID=UPI00262D8B13|nr:DUF924 family protein [Maricaulis sp.]MDM7984656.1 DUF924 family protein [Maricaulis sp.]
MSVLTPTPDEIIDFWFNEAGPKKWYATSPAFDATVRRRFARAVDEHAKQMRAGRHPWLGNPDSAFALVLLFDQFPRNIWRGSGRAFSYDVLARNVSLDMIDRGFDWAIDESRRDFVYMPFMHGENLALQNLCIDLVRERLEGEGTLRHAIKHREVIARFGRFPYRNEALGRASTDEEREYLETGGYAPGRKKS